MIKAHGNSKRPYEALYNSLRYQATAYSLPVVLSFEEFVEFTAIQECVYCVAPIIWHPHNPSKPGRTCSYNLDRKDNAIGYSKENCVVACPSCNRVRSNVFSFEEMLELGKVLKKIRIERGLDRLPILVRKARAGV